MTISKRGRRMPVKSAGTIVRSRHDPSKPARLSSKQAARLDAMTDDEITAAALSDPDAQPWSDADFAGAKQAWGAKIKVIRRKLGMSQAAFAEAFGFTLGALQGW
ncbi:MAG: helix-turn-helix domain-containing protein, partial [Geminicoccaceae bacterium]